MVNYQSAVVTTLTDTLCYIYFSIRICDIFFRKYPDHYVNISVDCNRSHGTAACCHSN